MPSGIKDQILRLHIPVQDYRIHGMQPCNSLTDLPLRSQAVFRVSDTDPLPHILPDSFLRYKCVADKHSHPPYAELPADTDSDSVPKAVPVLHTLSADCLCLLFLFLHFTIYFSFVSFFSAANSSSSPPAHNNRKAQNTRPVKRRAVSVLPALYNFAKFICYLAVLNLAFAGIPFFFSAISYNPLLYSLAPSRSLFAFTPLNAFFPTLEAFSLVVLKVILDSFLQP